MTRPKYQVGEIVVKHGGIRSAVCIVKTVRTRESDNKVVYTLKQIGSRRKFAGVREDFVRPFRSGKESKES